MFLLFYIIALKMSMWLKKALQKHLIYNDINKIKNHNSSNSLVCFALGRRQLQGQACWCFFDPVLLNMSVWLKRYHW